MAGEAGGRRLDGVLRTAAWGGAALLFALAVAAEQFWAEMAWDGADFVVWGVMLLTACGAFELVMRTSTSWAYRFGGAITIGAAFLIVWVNGAVGIIGGEDHPGNLLYLAVLALGIGGAFSADFKPRGLARATVAMAVGVVLVGALALAGRWGAGGEPNWALAIAGSSAFFGAAWLVSAWLFRQAARVDAAG